MNIFSTRKSEKVRKAFFSGFLILSLVLSQATLPLSIAYATDGGDQQTITTDQPTDTQQQEDQQSVKHDDDQNNNEHHDDDDNNDKVNICHATGSQNNPWNAISVDQNALQTHLGHGDFAYAGPTDDGKPKHGDDWCKDHAPKPTPTATIEAKKIVCDSEADLPNWGARDVVTSITAGTAAQYLMTHSHCKLVPWTFEWAASSATNPGDNVQTGGTGWTAFTSTATVPVGSTLWVREQTQSGYVPFSGATSDKVVLTSPEAQNSAEMYCDTDVYNYDNFDRTDTINADETHHCIAFNAKIPQQLSCNPEVNLIENGDFEAPALSANSWDVIPTSNPLLKWLVDWVNTPVNASARLGLEIQNHVAGSPFAGAQHAELDGDAPVTISQNIATIPGKQYSLTFQYSPRPGVANNALQPKVDGSVLGAVVNADGSANADTVWQPVTRTFVATSALTKVEIADVGPEDSLGGYIDNVSLTCTGDPAPQCKEAATSSLVSDGTTMVDGHGAIPVTTPVHSAWTASIPGATWIWSEADVLDATVDTTKTFTKTFNIVGTPLDSTLTLAADNNYDVYVNSTLDTAPGCSDSTGATFGNVQTCAIPAAMLLSGTNTISIVVKNWAVAGSDAKSNPAGLLYKLTLNNNECVTPEPKGGAVHIFKFVNGVQATVENTQGVSFPMFTATYNAPFTLSPTGWGSGDSAYEASTGTLSAGATYTANEDLSGSLVGASCEVGNHSYELVGYSTGNSLEAAKNAVKSTTAPTVSINGDKYIIVWNKKCGQVEGAHTLKVHLYKYLKDGNTESQIPNTSEVAPFPMTATWKTANLNGGVSASSPYVLGNYHGQPDLKYAADTAPMEAPADYTSSEVTSADSDFLPIGAQCVPGKYRLLGYRSSAVSLDNAEDMPLMSVAPEFVNLNDDRWVIVVNEKCADKVEGETINHTTVVKAADLAADISGVIASPTKWFFYNDETDTIDNTLGSFVAGPSTAPIGTGSAQMSVSGSQRRNIATYQFKDVKLSDITNLSFSTYAQLAGDGALGLAERSPYLNFNIDFTNSDAWQGRLVYVPAVNGTVTADTWQTWNTTGTGLWTWSKFASNGNKWPDNNTNEYRTWNDLVAAFPNIQTRSTDSWFGFRVGEPYADGFTGNVDKVVVGIKSGINTNIETYDFEPTAVVALPQCSDGIDNADEEDTLVDAADPACHSDHNVNNSQSYTPNADSESNDSAVCSDGKDNDGDNLIDSLDPVCHSDGNVNNIESWNPNGTTESNGGGSGPILPPSGGGNGGGMILPTAKGKVLGASTQCGLYLDDFLKMGKKNNKDEVKKLQTFLNDYLKLKPKLAVNGIFGIQTYKAVLKFQEQESDYVIKPWVGLTLKDSKKGTGWVYKTTVTRINNIMCPELNLQNPPLTID